MSYYKELLDPVTHLRCYSTLMDELDISSSATLILVEIDNFDIIKELYGFKVSNEVLVKFAAILTEINENKNYNMYRVSAGEFALLDCSEVFDTQLNFETIETLMETFEDNEIYIPMLDCKPPQKLDHLKQNNSDKINQEHLCEEVSLVRNRL
ncbi:MAG: diguanylate cyclase [Helicobacteraceae bacterium]|nr:diguanylate cyclase [Helicobacteraceae bacterium]